ncbi:hypothetical protein [Psychromonas arctica]|uniref:hypothetical protein n=1 Tax=Psychromonas arctica TaxID=168275 RepID=UPI0003FEEAA0|nr:hypothetical protein [Psychromonas arctica]
MKKILISIITILIITGCSSIPVANTDNEEHKKIVSFKPANDSSVIYLYRDRTSDFGLFELSIDIGGDDIDTYAACYRRIELSPGLYHIEADHPDVFGFEDEIDFDAVLGEISFFEYLPIARFGVPGSTKIVPKEKEEAINIIKSQNLCANPLVKIISKS